MLKISKYFWDVVINISNHSSHIVFYSLKVLTYFDKEIFQNYLFVGSKSKNIEISQLLKSDLLKKMSTSWTQSCFTIYHTALLLCLWKLNNYNCSHRIACKKRWINLTHLSVISSEFIIKSYSFCNKVIRKGILLKSM